MKFVPFRFKVQYAALLLFLTPLCMKAQCSIFKSELQDVKNYMIEVGQLTDSIQTFTEAAAYGGRFDTAKKDARKVEVLLGQALTSADEAVRLASDVQYYSEICGIDEVKSYAIDTESNAIDAQEFASEAYTNVKSALTAKNLGNVHYHMRKAERASIEARNSAEAATYAAAMTHSQCTHVNTETTNIDLED